MHENIHIRNTCYNHHTIYQQHVHENVAESTMEISLKLIKLGKTISTGYILPII